MPIQLIMVKIIKNEIYTSQLFIKCITIDGVSSVEIVMVEFIIELIILRQ